MEKKRQQDEGRDRVSQGENRDSEMKAETETNKDKQRQRDGGIAIWTLSFRPTCTSKIVRL